jgi:hypothetical protein
MAPLEYRQSTGSRSSAFSLEDCGSVKPERWLRFSGRVALTRWNCGSIAPDMHTDKSQADQRGGWSKRRHSQRGNECYLIAFIPPLLYKRPGLC